MKFIIVVLISMVILPRVTHAREIQTNSVSIMAAPDWLTRVRVEKVIDHIQMVLEWSIRKVPVHWHSDKEKFIKLHNLGPSTLAFSRRSDHSIHLGPRVTTENFNAVFGHELVHVISFQKYKEAIPRWLEEGLANYLAKMGKVDYKWLNQQPFPSDVRTLVHPSRGSVTDVRYNYLASQAVVEMIAAKCDLANLLRLSVGKNMDVYLNTYCEIKDLNQNFKKWVKSKA